MVYFFSFMRGVFLLVILCALPLTAWSQSLSEKAALQAAMQRFIDRQTIDGVYHYIDENAGEVRTLHPVTAHPKILTMGEHYVLCFDFRNDDGDKVNVDFYMARKNESFIVFHTAVDDHTLIDLLLRQGKLGGAG